MTIGRIEIYQSLLIPFSFWTYVHIVMSLYFNIMCSFLETRALYAGRDSQTRVWEMFSHLSERNVGIAKCLTCWTWWSIISQSYMLVSFVILHFANFLFQFPEKECLVVWTKSFCWLYFFYYKKYFVWINYIFVYLTKLIRSIKPKCSVEQFCLLYKILFWHYKLF